MAKKEYEPEDLIDFIQIEASISCDNCKKGDCVMYSDTGEEYFFERGWRATRQKVYCPECAAKKLKLY